MALIGDAWDVGFWPGSCHTEHALPDNLRPDETWHRLREWTYGQAPSERLAAQVLLAEGYTDVDPSHPLGGRDGGADALAMRDGLRWLMAAHFPRGQQPLKDITDKFNGDLAGLAANNAEAIAFVTNQELTRGERKSIREAAGVPVELYHLERLATLLDQPRMHPVREQFLFIPIAGSSGLGASARYAELMRASIARCAGRWLAVGLSRDEAVALADDTGVGAPSADLLPDESRPVVIWTGPMGSGKSIAAERVHQRDVLSAAQMEDAPVPVFLGAAECIPSLSAAATAACAEIGDPRRRGARLVVDGLDETGQEAAGNLRRRLVY